ncbi:hypothetical protein D3C76_803580 [compost metagenome]
MGFDIDDLHLSAKQGLALGACLVQPHLRCPETDGATELGGAIDLLHLDAGGHAGLDQRRRYGRRATGHPLQGAAVHLCLAGHREESLKHDRHGHQAGDALLGNRLPRLEGVEVRQQDRRATLEHIGHQGRQASDMEHRRDQQEAVIPPPVQGTAVGLRARDHRLVRDHGALRMSGGARRVHDHRRVLERRVANDRRVAVSGADDAFMMRARAVRLRTDQQEPGPRSQQSPDGLAELFLVDQGRRGAVGQDVLQLLGLEAPVQDNQGGSQAPGSKKSAAQNLAVPGEHCDALARVYTLGSQVARKSADPLIELPECPSPGWRDEGLSRRAQYSSLGKQLTQMHAHIVLLVGTASGPVPCDSPARSG